MNIRRLRWRHTPIALEYMQINGGVDSEAECKHTASSAIETPFAYAQLAIAHTHTSLGHNLYL